MPHYHLPCPKVVSPAFPAVELKFESYHRKKNGFAHVTLAAGFRPAELAEKSFGEGRRFTTREGKE